jgi:L-asparagine transporter-like permease
MYLVSGMVAKKMAGPAVVLSYAIAGVAAMLSGEVHVVKFECP